MYSTSYATPNILAPSSATTRGVSGSKYFRRKSAANVSSDLSGCKSAATVEDGRSKVYANIYSILRSKPA